MIFALVSQFKVYSQTYASLQFSIVSYFCFKCASAFKQEKALVAFSLIVKTDGSFAALIPTFAVDHNNVVWVLGEPLSHAVRELQHLLETRHVVVVDHDALHAVVEVVRLVRPLAAEVVQLVPAQGNHGSIIQQRYVDIVYATQLFALF